VDRTLEPTGDPDDGSGQAHEADADARQQVHKSRRQDSWLITTLDRTLISNLWLRTIVLGSISVLVMIYGFNYQPHLKHPTAITDLAYIASQLGPALLVAVVGAALVQSVIMRDPEAHKGLHQRLREQSQDSWHSKHDDNLKQTKSVLDESMSIINSELSNIREVLHGANDRAKITDALSRSGVVSAYRSHKAAVADMARTLRQENLTEIQLLGLSLNTWFAGSRRDLGDVLQELVLSARSSLQRPAVNVKILLIDPYSAGARFITKSSETQDSRERAERLRDEVRFAARHVMGLQDRLSAENNGSSIQARLYRSSPGFYAFSSNRGTFIRTYQAAPPTLWSDAPVWLYDYNSKVHASVRSHFKLMWEQAVEPEKILKEWCYGVDQGLAESGLENVFTDEERAMARMAWLIEHAERRVWIQGVSLAPMFRPRLERAMHDLFAKSDVDTRLLILDPECEEAYYKSFRDHLVGDRSAASGLTFEGYRSDQSLHASSALCSNIRYSAEQVRSLASDTAAANLRVRYYSCAPNSFVLIADDVALVEQYHYGKAPHARRNVLQLTQEMPLFEYQHPRTRLFERRQDVDPFEVVEDSFTHVFNFYSRPYTW
jgi:hypothetical protein